MVAMGTPDAHAPAPRPIFIHGSGGDHRVWDHQTACFDGALAVDLPGHPDGTALRDAAAIAAIVAAALEDVPGPRALVGHSLGGAVALEIARVRPDLVDGLVIVASGARLPVPDRIVAGLHAGFERECTRLLEGFFAQPDGVAVAVGEALAAVGPDTLDADYAACRSVDLRGRLDGVHAPTLVLAGRDDPLTPPWLSEELTRELPDARLVVIEGARHMPMVDAPEAVNMLLAAHLARMGS